MSLSYINLKAIDRCSAVFNECKAIEDNINHELRPIEEVIENMVAKTTNILNQVSSGPVTQMKRIQGVMIITIAIDTCTEKIEILERALTMVKSNMLKLVTLQNLDISPEVMDLIVKTSKNVNMISKNIHEDMVETASARGFYVRARTMVDSK